MPDTMSPEEEVTLESPEEEVTLERYPTLRAPDSVRPNEVFPVTASLELEPPEPGAVAQEMVLPDRDRWEITAVLEAPDFEILEDEPHQTINMEPDSASTDATYRLQLRAPEPGGQPPADALIAVEFWLENQRIARVSKLLAIGEVGDGAEPVSGRVRFDPRREQADLIVTIANGHGYVSAPGLGLVGTVFPVAPLTADDLDELRGQYERLAGISASRHLGGDGPPVPEDDLAARATVRRAGWVFWDRLAPEPFKELFWLLVEELGEDFDSIQIYTDDPGRPWELMRPYREGAREWDFLGLEMEVARGHTPRRSGVFGRGPASVHFERLLVMRPEYDPPLPGTAQELLALQGFTPVAAEVVLSTYAELARLVPELPDGILHFAGHGVETTSAAGGTDYQILLDRPVSLSQWFGLLPRPRFESRPFIFFNACEVGRSHPSFGFAEGWAPAFLDAGAAGYVGTLWPVSDRPAARFAARFYQVLEEDFRSGARAGSPSRALREARRLYEDDPDPTYLAYVYYGETDLGLAW